MIDKEKILYLYYIKKYKQVEIVKLLNISKSTVNRIIISDDRYLNEKNRRQEANKIKNRKETIQYITSSRKQQGIDIIYEKLKQQHLEATMELSGGKKSISNRAFKEWNSSIYKYNEKNKSFVLKSGIIVGADVPKKINWDVLK